MGRDLCQHYWSFLTTISRTKISTVKEQLRAGHQYAPEVHTQRMLSDRDRGSLDRADAFFLGWYQDLGQNLAEQAFDDDEEPRNIMHEVTVLQDHPLRFTSLGLDPEAQRIRKYFHVK